MESAGIDDLLRGLAGVGYFADRPIAMAVYLGRALSKPILIEGPAGTGKTELAKSVAHLLDAPLIRLQCHEGLDEFKALYEWNYRKQLLWLQAARDGTPLDWASVESEIFGSAFLLERPLLRAIRAERQSVLLIDEVDRIEIEIEALLLEVLSEYQISIPELGTVTARSIPIVFLTSNATRTLSEALRRRCLFLYLDYPGLEREREIVRARVPDANDVLVDRLTSFVTSLRALELDKPPSISETIDWARALTFMGVAALDGKIIVATLNVLLKNRNDIDKVTRQLDALSK
jgi:MoxR-like ATPase